MPILSACSVRSWNLWHLNKKRKGKISLVWKSILRLPMFYSLAIGCLSLGCSGMVILCLQLLVRPIKRSPVQNNKLDVPSYPGRSGGLVKLVCLLLRKVWQIRSYLHSNYIWICQVTKYLATTQSQLRSPLPCSGKNPTFWNTPIMHPLSTAK